MLGDRDTVMGIKTRRHLKQKSFQECGFHLGGLGPDLFVNKNQELSVTGYNERGSFVPLLLDLWQAQLPGIRYFQAFPKSSNHRAKKPRHSVQAASCQGKGRPLPWDTAPMAQRRKETVTQGLSLPGHGGGTSGKGLSSATFEPRNISRFPLESF